MSEGGDGPFCRVCNKPFRDSLAFGRFRMRYACCNGRNCGCGGGTLPDDVCSMTCLENEAFEAREEDGPQDLEDQLESALDRAFP